MKATIWITIANDSYYDDDEVKRTVTIDAEDPAVLLNATAAALSSAGSLVEAAIEERIAKDAGDTSDD